MPASAISACIISGLERRIKTLGQFALRVLERLRHRLRHMRARQDVALHGIRCSLDMSLPIVGARPGVHSNVSLRVDNGELAPFLAFIGVLGEKLIHDLLRG